MTVNVPPTESQNDKAPSTSFEERNKKAFDVLNNMKMAADLLHEAYVALVSARAYFAEAGDFTTEQEVNRIGKRALAVYRRNVGVEIEFPNPKAPPKQIKENIRKSSKQSGGKSH